MFTAAFFYFTVPLCPSSIQNGAITGACSYLHRAECAYTCDRFYRPTTASSRLTCVNGKWDGPTPCSFSSNHYYYSVLFLPAIVNRRNGGFIFPFLMFYTLYSAYITWRFGRFITKTRLFKYIENFTTKK